MVRKIIRFIDNMIDKTVFLVCLVLFLLGSYGLYDSYMVYQQATDDSILKYKPGYETDDATNKKIKENMVAWLTVDNTNIDYPVMQGKDNNEYLNKDPFGDYSLSGSIFLDSRNNPDFDDYYSLVYGHHMEQGMMFGALDDYLKEGYLDSHSSGTLTVGEKNINFVFSQCSNVRQRNLQYLPQQKMMMKLWTTSSSMRYFWTMTQHLPKMKKSLVCQLANILTPLKEL